MSEESKQDKNYWLVLNAALELDVKKGHLKWTLSELSRKSKVTRSLIYYYFGRSKSSILEEAVKLIGTELTGLTESREQLWQEGRLLESLIRAREVVDKAPYLCLFILEHVNKPTELGDSIRLVQGKFLEKLQRFFALKDEHQFNFLFGVYWGLLFAPRQTPESYQQGITLLTKLLKK